MKQNRKITLEEINKAAATADLSAAGTHESDEAAARTAIHADFERAIETGADLHEAVIGALTRVAASRPSADAYAMVLRQMAERIDGATERTAARLLNGVTAALAAMNRPK